MGLFARWWREHGRARTGYIGGVWVCPLCRMPLPSDAPGRVIRHKARHFDEEHPVDSAGVSVRVGNR